jgi:hypothetical protein
VCVKVCPDKNVQSDCKPNANFTTCPSADYDTNPCNPISLIILKLDLARYCFPNATDIANVLAEKIAGGDLARYFTDLATAWWVFLVMTAICLVITLLYMFLLRWTAKPVLYVSFVIIFLMLLGGGFYVWIFASQKYVPEDNTYKAMRGVAILLWILTGIYGIILLCCCSRIQLGVAIMEATSQFVKDTCSIVFVPIIFFVFTFVWMVFWIFSAVYVFSVGEIKKREGLPISDIVWDETTRYVWIYHLFGFFWISAFIIGCSQFIIAATTCVWYFAQGGSSDDKGKASLKIGFRWIFRYHVGSIAFGALIIAIIQMIKLMFEYLRKKYEKLLPSNPCTKCVICYFRYCIWILDYCIKFITKNAYIQIALTNKSFCPAALSTFFLIVRNAARFTIVSGIGAILMFVGKAFITILCGWIGYIILVNSELKDKIFSPIFPVIVICMIAYILSSNFLNVFSFASNAILHAFLIDEEVKGNRAPASLLGFVKRNDEMNAKKGKKGADAGGKADEPKEDEKKGVANDVA